MAVAKADDNEPAEVIARLGAGCRRKLGRKLGERRFKPTRLVSCAEDLATRTLSVWMGLDAHD
jgi:hypothetical protein